MNKKIKKILNKKNKSKIVCLTAYSKNIAEEIDKHADIVLVGDSLGSVLYNYTTTRKVTLTEMINHSKSEFCMWFKHDSELQINKRSNFRYDD